MTPPLTVDHPSAKAVLDWLRTFAARPSFLVKTEEPRDALTYANLEGLTGLHNRQVRRVVAFLVREGLCSVSTRRPGHPWTPVTVRLVPPSASRASGRGSSKGASRGRRARA